MASQPRPSGIPVPPARQSASRVASPFEAPGLSQAARIDELVQKLRTLEHTNSKLQDQIEREKTRYETTISNLRHKWQEEQKQWYSGCDTLQGCHRLAQLRILVDYSKQRSDALLEQDVARREKLARLQRDFRITSFQRRERELEATVEDLQAKLDDQLADTDTRAEELKAQNTALISQATHREQELKELQEEIEGLREEMSAIRKDQTHLRSEKDTKDGKLERTNLHLQSANTAKAELQKTLDEVKLTNVQLKQQLQRWEDLDKKGGEEASDLRKQRVELQVQVKSLQEQLEETEGTVESLQEQVQELKDKGKKRTEKMEQVNQICQQWKEVYEAQSEELADVNKHVADLRDCAKRAEQLVARLRAEKAALLNASRDDSAEEAEVAILAASSPVQSPSVSPRAKQETERSSRKTQASKKPSSTNKRAKRQRTPEEEADDSSIEEIPQPETPPKPGGSKTSRRPTAGTKRAAPKKTEPRPKQSSKAKQAAKEQEAEESDAQPQGQEDEAGSGLDDDPPQNVPKRKTKGKQKPVAPEPEAVEEAMQVDDDDQVEPQPTDPPRSSKQPKPATTNRRARGNTQPQTVNDTQQDVKASDAAKVGRKPASKAKGKEKAAPESSKAKGKSSQQPADTNVADTALAEDDDEIQEVPPKKKRKIGGFSGSQAPPNLFGTFSQDTGVFGGMIPTDLSPIKATDKVPARASSVMGGSTLTMRERLTKTFKPARGR